MDEFYGEVKMRDDIHHPILFSVSGPDADTVLTLAIHECNTREFTTNPRLILQIYKLQSGKKLAFSMRYLMKVVGGNEWYISAR